MTWTTDTVTENRTTENRTPRLAPLREGEKAMFRARLRNALFDELRALFRRRRKQGGWKQKDVADRLGIDPGTVSRRLKGGENVTLDWVSDFARALDARVEVRIVPLEAVKRPRTPTVAYWSDDQTAPVRPATGTWEILTSPPVQGTARTHSETPTQ